MVLTNPNLSGIGDRYRALCHGQNPWAIPERDEQFIRPGAPTTPAVPPAQREHEAQNRWRRRNKDIATNRHKGVT